MNVSMKKETASDFLKPRKIKNKLTGRKQSVQPTAGTLTPIINFTQQQNQPSLLSVNPISHSNSFLQTSNNHNNQLTSQISNNYPVISNSHNLVNINNSQMPANSSNQIGGNLNMSNIQVQMNQRKLISSKEMKQRNQLLQNLMQPQINNNNQQQQYQFIKQSKTPTRPKDNQHFKDVRYLQKSGGRENPQNLTPTMQQTFMQQQQQNSANNQPFQYSFNNQNQTQNSNTRNGNSLSPLSLKNSTGIMQNNQRNMGVNLFPIKTQQQQNGQQLTNFNLSNLLNDPLQREKQRQGLLTAKETSNNQKRREKQIVSTYLHQTTRQDQSQVTQNINGQAEVTKELRIQKMKEEIKKNEQQLQNQMQASIKASQIQSQLLENNLQFQLTPNSQKPSNLQKIDQLTNALTLNHQSSSNPSLLLSPYLQPQNLIIPQSSQQNLNTQQQNNQHQSSNQISNLIGLTKKQKLQQAIKTVQNKLKLDQKQYLMQQISQQNGGKNLLKAQNKERQINMQEIEDFQNQSMLNEFFEESDGQNEIDFILQREISGNNFDKESMIGIETGDFRQNKESRKFMGNNEDNFTFMSPQFQNEKYLKINHDDEKSRLNNLVVLDPENSDRLNNKNTQGIFGQISPKFYKDQPAANLLEIEDDYIQVIPQSKMSASFVVKNQKNVKNQGGIKEYEDIEDNEAQYIKSSKSKVNQKFLQSQQIKKDIKRYSKEPQLKEYADADEMYNDLIEDLQYISDKHENQIHSTGSHGFQSRGSMSQELLSSGIPQNMKKIRMESFAKTPFFLKSPRSLASSQFAGANDLQLVNLQDQHEYISLNTYNGDQDLVQDLDLAQNPIMKKQNHLYKLSQSSDEIARTVNIFFENKGVILGTIPSQNNLLQLAYSPLMTQNHRINNNLIIANNKKGNQQISNNVYIDPSKINQLQIFNNANIQIPMVKYMKEGKSQAIHLSSTIMRM
eukprot:403342539